MAQFISVSVITRASKNEIIKIDNDNYKIKTTTAPIKGAANKEIILLLSNYFNLPKSSISIVKGKTSNKKRVKLQTG